MKPTAGPATRDWEIFLRKSTARVGGGERARLVPQLRRLRVPAQPTQTTPSLPAAVSSGNLPNACAQSPANRDESPATPEACAFIYFHGIDVRAPSGPRPSWTSSGSPFRTGPPGLSLLICSPISAPTSSDWKNPTGTKSAPGFGKPKPGCSHWERGSSSTTG